MRIFKGSSEAFLNIPPILKKRALREDGKIEEVVKGILKRVSSEGDSALFEFTRAFDGCDLQSLEIAGSEMEAALLKADKALLKAMDTAKRNITEFHEKQKREGFRIEKNGTVLGQKFRALKRVGVYIPGGRAFYPSTVLMNIIPAKVAGVSEIIAVTPPGKDGTVPANVLAAMALAGVTRAYKLGGAQAIGALAYGTETIPKVDKIVGPGNTFVAAAKRQVFGIVDIDMIAGPSEILIIADEGASPALIAADMLSQAEHDPLASAMALVLSEGMAEQIKREAYAMAKALPRRAIIEESLENFGLVGVMDSLSDAISLANEIAPEHLELMTENPMDYLDRIENAGSIFLGKDTPEALGDYIAGVNHVLPTDGTARFFSPLSVDSFIKKSSFLFYSREALSNVRDDTCVFAEFEGLSAHAQAVEARFKGGE